MTTEIELWGQEMMVVDSLGLTANSGAAAATTATSDSERSTAESTAAQEACLICCRVLAATRLNFHFYDSGDCAGKNVCDGCCNCERHKVCVFCWDRMADSVHQRWRCFCG